MKLCNKCNVKIASDLKACPLCQAKLENLDNSHATSYPFIPTAYKQFNLFFKIAIFASICIFVVVGILDVLFIKDWLVIILTVAGLAYMWGIITLGVRKRKNLAKNILHQVVLISLAAITIDYLTGFDKWSTNYITPFLFLLALIAIAIISRVFHHNAHDYIVYLIVNLVFSAIQLAFGITNLVVVVWPSLVCLGFSIICVTAILIFDGVDIKEELKRRFHL